MRTRTLFILLIILGVLAGVGALVMRSKAPTASNSTLGKRLLENLPANEISSITLKDRENSVSLAKKSDRWVVEDRFDYPADFSKIAAFVRKLKNAKIGRQFESSEETLKRLSLKDPDDKGATEEEKGTQVQFKDGSAKVLAFLILGKTREAGGERSFPVGHYVRVGDAPTIYLIDTHFAHMQKDPSDWLDKNLVEVDENEVRKISCLSQDGETVQYTFERSEKGEALEPKTLPVNRKVSKSALDRLARSLSSLQMEEVVDPSNDSVSSDLEQSNRLEYQLFNGMTYHVYPGKPCADADNCYLKLRVTYQEPAPLKEEKKEEAEAQASEKEETTPEKTPEEMALEAKQLSDRFSPWVYMLPKWQHEAFMTDPEKLMEKPDKGQQGKPEEKG